MFNWLTPLTSILASQHEELDFTSRAKAKNEKKPLVQLFLRAPPLFCLTLLTVFRMTYMLGIGEHDKIYGPLRPLILFEDSDLWVKRRVNELGGFLTGVWFAAN